MDKLTKMQPAKTLLGSALLAAWGRIQESLPNEMTGNMKIQFLGIYSAVIILHENGKPATANSISEFTGTNYPSVSRITRVLHRMGLLERIQTLGSHGKGIQYSFIPRYQLQELPKHEVVPQAEPEIRGRRMNLTK